MIKLKAQQLDVIAAPLVKLSREQLPVKTSYQLLKIIQKLEQEAKILGQAKDTIMSQFCTLEGEKWVPKEETKQELVLKLQEFDQTEIVIDRNKISVDEIMNAKLSAFELQAIEPFLHELKAV